jgi:hypothetical protein
MELARGTPAEALTPAPSSHANLERCSAQTVVNSLRLCVRTPAAARSVTVAAPSSADANCAPFRSGGCALQLTNDERQTAAIHSPATARLTGVPKIMSTCGLDR